MTEVYTLIKHHSCKGRWKLSLNLHTSTPSFLFKPSKYYSSNKRKNTEKVIFWILVVFVCFSKMRVVVLVSNLKWTSFVLSCGPDSGGLIPL